MHGSPFRHLIPKRFFRNSLDKKEGDCVKLLRTRSILLYWASGPQPGAVFPPKGNLEYLETFFIMMIGTIGIQ